MLLQAIQCWSDEPLVSAYYSKLHNILLNIILECSTGQKSVVCTTKDYNILLGTYHDIEAGFIHSHDNQMFAFVLWMKFASINQLRILHCIGPKRKSVLVKM
jgi:hypothetical protein